MKSYGPPTAARANALSCSVELRSGGPTPARVAGMLEGSSRQTADANEAGTRLQRIDAWVVVEDIHPNMTVSDGAPGEERAPTRLIETFGLGAAVCRSVRRGPAGLAPEPPAGLRAWL